eukprot:TRINITY_DN14686_c0_g1_i1.p1 TRINITY_DN14686_c0_g1~~TRINITY_DN14686_c0_g1_i1.p1  ORF type:complete len:1358 (+),score=454.93 TRINITY_DN14686_c0_g1_i1:61-4134(+)
MDQAPADAPAGVEPHASSPGSAEDWDWWVWVLIGAGALAVVGAFICCWRRSRRSGYARVGAEEDECGVWLPCILNPIWLSSKLLMLQIRGFSTRIREEDIPRITPPEIRKDEAHVDRCTAAWVEECRRHPDAPSVPRTLFWRLHCKNSCFCVFWSVLYAVMTCMVRPYVLKKVIDHAADGEDFEAKKWAAVLIAFVFGEAMCFLFTRHEGGTALASRLLFSLCTLVQRKSLRIAPGVAGDTSERTLINQDVMQGYENTKYLCQLPAAFAQLPAGIFMVVHTVGSSGWIGSGLMLAVLSFSIWVSHVNKRMELARLKHTDKRLGITTRTIDAIKAVKFCAWEGRFKDDILDARERECAQLRRVRMLMFLNVQLGRVLPYICTATTISALAALGHDLEAGQVFATLTVFQSLRLALTFIPMCTTLVSSFNVSMLRVETYLALPEFQPLPQPDDAHAVVAEDAALSWPRKAAAADAAASPRAEFTLSGLSLRVGWGNRVAIVGSVGSGKSSLISALLGNMQLDGGRLACCTSRGVGLVPQKAFVVSGTLKYNVVFGRPWDPARFDAAVRASAMDADLVQLAGGVETEIGERGVTLSGGQQQRLSIARALYGSPGLLVMDDPLAAVDGAVAQQIFHRAVLGEDGGDAGRLAVVAPPGRAVLMVLNQFRFLEHFDHVLFVKGGRVLAQGAPAELLASCAEFSDFVGGSIGDGPGAKAALASEVIEEPAHEKSGGLSEPERRAEGSVQMQIYWRFIASMGRVKVVGVMLLLGLSYGTMAFADQWLSHWVSEADLQADDPSHDVDTFLFAAIYSGATVTFMLVMLVAGVAVGVSVVAASRAVHDDCLTHLLRAPVSFFEATPSGRILSRFGADVAMLDGMLAIITEVTVSFSFILLVLTVTICVIAPIMVSILFGAGIVYVFQVVAQDRTNIEVKRMAITSLSPLLGTLGEVGEPHAKLLVRVMDFGGVYEDKFDTCLERLNFLNFTTNALLNAGSCFSYLIGMCISAATSFFILGFQDTSASQLGLALSYSFLLPYYLQFLAQFISMLKVGIGSLERLLQCQDDSVPQEPDWTLSGDGDLTDGGWPKDGAVRFEDVSLVYREGLPPALQGCDFDIPGGYKVGVVGRTGAGKSSLFVSLFRLLDVAGGRVRVDGVPIRDVGLGTLRRRMAIIPQEPLLLDGTVRENLDPFGEHDAEAVCAALRQVGMEGRDDDNSQHLSAGERQLLQLARTLLRDVRIVVMDEPTSNVDPRTDAIMQRVVRSAFRYCTVVTIAHRLDTVIDGDMVLVMDKGRVLESGQPAALLAAGGALATMVEQQGPARAADLRKRAASAAQRPPPKPRSSVKLQSPDFIGLPSPSPDDGICP